MGDKITVSEVSVYSGKFILLNIKVNCYLYMQLWDAELVCQISLHPSVQRVVALGTLFALELQAEGSNAGYCLTTF